MNFKYFVVQGYCEYLGGGGWGGKESYIYKLVP
jgi:hypothetical protein